MKLLYFIMGVCFTSVISAQSIYEAGYFIDNNGTRKECLIKKLPWKNNPVEFEWKKTISSSPKKETIEDIKEFGVGEDYVFKRYILRFDLKGDNLGRATKSEKPDLQIRKIYLRIILKSKVTLYQYSESNVHRFFYTAPDTAYPELLLYKVYYTLDETEKPGEKIIPHENNTYKDQLRKKFACNKQDVSKLTYTQIDLKKYFKKYNECKGYKIEYNTRKKINQTRIGIVVAADLSGFSHPSSLPGADQDVVYENVFAPRYGFFVESFIPFTKVDLSFFLEATYKSLTTEDPDPFISNAVDKLEYKSANIALAPRFHIYLSSKFELFLEGGITADFDMGSESTEFEEDEIENITTDYFYGGGIGSGRFKIGVRKYTNKNISKSTRIPNSNLTNTSIYLAVNLF